MNFIYAAELKKQFNITGYFYELVKIVILDS